jgi:hypothetical protein
MNPFTDLLEEFLSSQTVYIPDHLQRAIGSAITQQLAGLEPGDRMEENPAGSASSLQDTAALPEEGKGESGESKEQERTSIWALPLRLSEVGRAWRYRTLP